MAIRRRFAGVPEEQLVAGQVQPVLRPGEPQRLADFSRTVEKLPALIGVQFVLGLAVPHPGQGVSVPCALQAPQQHRAGLPLGLGDEVETVVHAVDQIEIGGARLGEQSLGAPGALVAVGMAGFVDAAHVSLGLHDAAAEDHPVQPPYQILAQKVTGHVQRVPIIKFPRQFWQCSHLL